MSLSESSLIFMIHVSRQPYFYHEATAVTTWERPAVAPVAGIKTPEPKSAGKSIGGSSGGGMAGGLLSQIQVCLFPVHSYADVSLATLSYRCLLNVDIGFEVSYYSPSLLL